MKKKRPALKRLTLGKETISVMAQQSTFGGATKGATYCDLNCAYTTTCQPTGQCPTD